MTHTQKLYAARYFGDPDCRWWAVPQVLNHYACPLPVYRDLQLVGQHPGLLYLMLHHWAKDKPKAIQQAGRHFWHSLSWKQRHQPLPRDLGQRLVRVFRAGDSDLPKMVDRDFIAEQLYTEDGVVKSIQRGGFSYNDDDGSGEQEFWTTIECTGCRHEAHIREQLGGDSTVKFLTDNAHDLGGFTYVSGPYCRCDQCDTLCRVKLYTPTTLPEEGWTYLNEDCEGDWDSYHEHLDTLIEDMTKHLAAHGLPKPDSLRLEISHANWRGSDAWAECSLEGKALAETIRVDSEFTISNGALRCYPNGNAELTCRLSHHDVPTGSGVTVAPRWECELESSTEHLSFEEMNESVHGLARIAEILLCGSTREFEYSAGSTFKAVSRENLAYAIDWLARQCGLKEWDALEGYDLALGLLLERLADDVRSKQNVHLSQVQQVRDVLDHWLAEQKETE